MATSHRFAAAVMVLFAGSRARAWEPAGADVEKRVNELDKAWASLSHDATNDDIIQRSKQDPRPSWAAREAWKETNRGKNYGFGVGFGRAKKKPEKRIADAESSARAALGKMMGLDKVAAAVLDWYDDSEGRFYALAAAEFAAPPAEDAAEKVRALDRLGRADIERRDFVQCRARYSDAIKLAQGLGLSDPVRADLFAAMGSCLAAQGNSGYARKFFSRALELDPSAQTRREVEQGLRALKSP